MFVIKLDSLMPRRFYIPLRCLRRVRPKVYGRLLTKVNRCLSLQWLCLKEKWYQVVLEFGAQSRRNPFPLLSEPLPKSLITAVAGQSDRPSDLALPEIRLVIRNPIEGGLLITFPPEEPGSIRRLQLVQKAAAKHSQSQEELVLQLTALYVLPQQAERQVKVEGKSRLYAWMRRLPWLNFWKFELENPTTIEVFEEKPNSRRPAVICLDFGTSTTASSYLPVVATRSIAAEYAPMRDLRPWKHFLLVPEYDQPIRVPDQPGTPIEIQISYSLGELLPKNPGLDRFRVVHCVPEFCQEVRMPIGDQAQNPTIPSMLIRRSQFADEHATGDGTSKHAELIIGYEAESMLRGSYYGPKAEATYSPKLNIGRPSSNDKQSEKREDPARTVDFFAEYFDQVHWKLSREQVGMNLVERILYSYPVAWVKHQRDALREYLKRALERSHLRSRMTLMDTDQYQHGQVDPFHEAFSLDEASAAFLGFVQYRMRGLEGEDLVRAYQPYEPNPQEAEQYPKSIWVLVVDAGGGSTDVALLEIQDTRNPNEPVQSYVRQYFGLPKAGLEVTRLIAAHLKDLILKAAEQITDMPDLVQEVRELLRTHLQDENLDKKPARVILDKNTQRPITELESRRRKIEAFFDAAEKLKVELSRKKHSSGQDAQVEIDWTGFPHLAQKTLGASLWQKIEPHIETTISTKILSEAMQKVFKPVQFHIKRWFEKEDLRKALGERRLSALLIVGRSSLLPGLEELVLEAIPKKYRPFAFNRISAKNLFLHDPPLGIDSYNALKTLVHEGLGLQYRNSAITRGRALRCHPINTSRRDLAIGVMQQDIQTLQPVKCFHPDCDLLVEPDGMSIDENQDLIYDETNDTSKGFFIGYNYTGKWSSGPAEDMDPPLPFLHVEIQGGERGLFRILRFYFRQQSTTSVYLHRVALYRGDPKTTNPVVESDGQSPPSGVRAEQEIKLTFDGIEGRLVIRVKPFPFQEDFRLTGRIHLDLPNPIDSDLYPHG